MNLKHIAKVPIAKARPRLPFSSSHKKRPSSPKSNGAPLKIEKAPAGARTAKYRPKNQHKCTYVEAVSEQLNEPIHTAQQNQGRENEV